MVQQVSKLTELEQRYGGKLTPNGMIDHDYRNGKVKFLRFAGARCPICGKNHWCQINATGTKVVCQDLGSAPQKGEVINGFRYVYTIEKINGKLFELVDKSKATKFDPKNYHTQLLFKLASPKALDIMNRLVIAAYKLTSRHKQDLLKRGLTEGQINLHGSRGFGSYYIADENGQPFFVQAKSVRTEDGGLKYISRWNHVLSKLGLPTTLWHGVPGFYDILLKDKSNTKLPTFSSSAGKRGSQGMLIPYWDIYNRVSTFQVRVDKPAKYVSNLKVDQSKLAGQVDIYINREDDTYTATRTYGKNHSQETLIKEPINGRKHITFKTGVDVLQQEISFDVKTGGKYFWVSSKEAFNGSDNDGKTPVQVAYNPKIAVLSPNKKEDIQKLKKYIAKPKSIWVTEGGLKGYIAACNLSKQFTDEQLDLYGRDFLAVGGVSSYHKFFPVLKKLNVNTVTIAFDMDMLNNDQVADNYAKLINELHKRELTVNIAVWDPTQAKGIDDALVTGVPITVAPQNN